MNNVTLAGSVDQIIFQNKENGFCIVKIKKPIAAVIQGICKSLELHVLIKCKGKWVQTNYGKQFKADTITIELPVNKNAIEKYLCSGVIKGIGPVLSNRLVKYFGKDIFDIIDSDPERLKQVPGVTNNILNAIKDSWSKYTKSRDSMVFLNELGLGAKTSQKIYDFYLDETILKVKENPYSLIQDIIGIGFTTADKIALSLNIPKDSAMRISSGLNHILSEASASGSCGLPTSELIKEATTLLEISQDSVINAAKSAIQNKTLIVDTINDTQCIFSAKQYNCETRIAETFLSLIKNKSYDSDNRISSMITNISNNLSIELDDCQVTAIKSAVSSNFSIITGGPGTGKTTILNFAVKILAKLKCDVALCCPTGKAAKRLSEVTDHTATTIHSCLKLYKKDFELTDLDIEIINGFDFLIIDEASMIDIHLMDLILKRMPDDCSLLLVGDVDQLPSIGAGKVLTDIIDSGIAPVTKLTKIHRQNDTSTIATNAARINSGLLPITNNNDFGFVAGKDSNSTCDTIVKLVSKIIPMKFGIKSQDIAVLSPIKKSDTGIINLNTKLQEVLNPYSESLNQLKVFDVMFRENDLVMQTKNDYDKGVMNGEVGTIKDISTKFVIITFKEREVFYNLEKNDLDNIIHAFAMTIHKSQGSEYQAVVIPVMYAHHYMLKRNLLYTAVTRAKKLVILVGEINAIQHAVSTIDTEKRWTTLQKQLIDFN